MNAYLRNLIVQPQKCHIQFAAVVETDACAEGTKEDVLLCCGMG